MTYNDRNPITAHHHQQYRPAAAAAAAAAGSLYHTHTHTRARAAVCLSAIAEPRFAIPDSRPRAQRGQSIADRATDFCRYRYLVRGSISNKAVADRRLRPRCRQLESYFKHTVIFWSLYIYPGTLCADMTSSLKRNVSLCRHRRTEPRPW